ncbi:hypothetical protein RJ55_01265 [Drechmeria coniospora]|nr:hypothetical protein RJ55_01265 [Drechmeria coniospora]
MENAALRQRVLSATFTVPHLLQYRKGKGARWELKHEHHCSAHIDALAYLSSNKSPWDHIVVAWTGEIGHVSMADALSSSPHATPASTPLSTPTPNYEQGQTVEDANTDALLIALGDVTKLEEQLYNDGMRTIPIWLADDPDITDEGIRLKQQSRWRRYAEHDLCALFHYKQHPPTDGRKEHVRWNDYYRMNEGFANKICDIYKQGDIVMVHDYHLMLLPKLLRQRRPDIHIVFFLGSPFPTSEFIRCLPRRKQILEGILGSDLVCFQAFHFAQHFASSCARILNYSANSDGVDVPGSRRAHIANPWKRSVHS